MRKRYASNISVVQEELVVGQNAEGRSGGGSWPDPFF